MLAPSIRPATRVFVLILLLPGLDPAAAVAQPSAGATGIVWRTDYNAARKEAQDKGLPILLVVGTDDCFYCRKLEATTFRDPAVAGFVSGEFVALKLDANREPALAKSLKVQMYPTMVLAGADGKIHAFIEGYVEAGRLTEHMKRASAASATADWMARDYNEASKAIGAGDYPRAVSLLKGLVAEAGNRPVGVKAKDLLAGVERQAAGRLARARDLELKGYTPEALDALAELVKDYAGTQAAGDATGLMAGLAEKPENLDRQRARQARDLLAMAKEEFRRGRYHDCLQRCEQLSTGYPDRTEAKEAGTLAAEIKDNPERLAAACEQMNEKTAAMYLTLADSWVKKGQNAEATACLEKVMKLAPNSRQAEFAQARLTKIQGREPASAASFRKP
jgi:thioredoxin-like negative regulator of GroEL